MVMSEVLCIYCGKRIDPSKGEGDHIIPKAFGEFRGDLHFRRICGDCNTKIGKAESVLIRCGPESYFRGRAFGQIMPKKEIGFSAGAEGMPPPKIYFDDPNLGFLLSEKILDEDASVVFEQINIKNKKGDIFHIRIFPEMTSKSLKEKYDSFGFEDKTEMGLSCDEENWEIYTKLIEETFHMKMKLVSTRPVGRSKEFMRVNFKVDDNYFRAMAKIAFHYYLTYFGEQVIGNEYAFKPIREFIYLGGKPDSYINKGNYFLKFLHPQNMAPARWMHILGVNESNGLVTGYVCLYWGPHRNKTEYYIKLGHLPRLINYDYAKAHIYLYDEKVTGGKVGEVREINLTRIPK